MLILIFFCKAALELFKRMTRKQSFGNVHTNIIDDLTRCCFYFPCLIFFSLLDKIDYHIFMILLSITCILSFVWEKILLLMKKKIINLQLCKKKKSTKIYTLRNRWFFRQIIYNHNWIMADPFVTTQQPLAGDQKNPVLLSSGPVTVRNLSQSPEDRTFLGEVMVDGFEGKIVHATSRNK